MIADVVEVRAVCVVGFPQRLKASDFEEGAVALVICYQKHLVPVVHMVILVRQ
ncbi:Uncharacterised protein [Shigella sonnei]|nr:Uncharacterised protein [Shigella sonnei]CST45221.1 Uncharacterised protein [Shigella sonnei]